MTRGKHRTDWLAAAGLAIAVALPVPCLAYRGLAYRDAVHPQEHNAAPAPVRPQQAHPQAQVHAQPQGHAGDWLRHYKDLPPAEQERELQRDPTFRRLPPARQQLLRQRLRHFSSLPPQQQLRMLNRMETWEHLTPTQKAQARQLYGQMRQLPPDRQRAVGTAIHELRGLPPEQREKVIDSPRIRSMFSDHERDMMRGATRLPLAPAEGDGP